MIYPKVSFLIPTKNEEKTIGKCIDSLLELDYPKEKIEIIIVEGKSEDNTKKILNEYAKKYSNISVYYDDSINKPESRNMCIKKSSGDFLISYSGHATAEKDLLKILIPKFTSNEIAGVGCPNFTPNKDFLGKSIGTLFTGFMAGGGTEMFTQNANFSEEKFVDHVPFVIYRKDIFKHIGLYDKNLQYGQDAEFNIRLKKHGYKLLYSPKTKIFLYKPTSLKKLFMKMYFYGIGRAKIVKKHPDQSNLFYVFFPIIFIICPFSLILLSIITMYYDPLYLLLFACICYSTLCLISSFLVSKKIKKILLGLIVYPIIHIGYSLGLLKGMSS